MKKCQPFGLMVAFMALVTLCLAQEGRDEKKASSTTVDTHRSHEVVRPEDIRWGPASPKLLPGAQFAVLLGDPSKAGAVCFQNAPFEYLQRFTSRRGLP